jgi:hypothetical protein
MQVTLYNVGFVYEETESGIMINIRYKDRDIQTDDSSMTTVEC